MSICLLLVMMWWLAVVILQMCDGLMLVVVAVALCIDAYVSCVYALLHGVLDGTWYVVTASAGGEYLFVVAGDVVLGCRRTADV